VNQHIALVRPLLDERAHSRWLGYCLLSRVGKSQFGELLYGGTKDGLSLQDVKDLQVLLPPLDEQRTIVNHLDEKTAQIDALIERVEDGIERLREYRTALISTAVTGEIDVREAAVEKKKSAQPVKEIDTWARMNLVIELIRRMQRHKHFGRVMLVKMLYLIEHHLRVEGMRMTYRRKDFGPYDPSFRYGLEEKLKEQDWYRPVERQRGGFRQTEYIPLEKAKEGKGEDYFQSSWGHVEEQIDQIVRQFRKFDTEQAEIVATLYAAWNDLLILDEPHEDDDIIREVLTNWHPRKQDINEETWRDALQWMQTEGLVPTGYGEPTVGAESDE